MSVETGIWPSGELHPAAGPHKDSHKSGGSDALTSVDLLEAHVIRVKESGGTVLTTGAFADGEFIKRSGTSLISAPGGGGDTHPVDDTTTLVRDPVDYTKTMRIDVGAIATGTTRVVTMPDADINLGDVHTHANKAQLDVLTDGDHDVRTDNPHSVTAAQAKAGKVIVVAKSGGDYTSIVSAMADAIVTGASAANPVMVLVYPGIYTETAITIPSYVSLRGMGGAKTVIIEASVATQTMVTIKEGALLADIRLKGANGAGGTGIHANSALISPDAWAIDCSVKDCETGVKLSGGSKLELITTHVEGNTYSLDLQHASDIIHCYACEIDHLKVQSIGEVRGSYFSDAAGDISFQVISELHIGKYDAGKEASIGQGDSHTIGMTCLTNTNLEAGTWADVTSTMASPSSSSAAIFPGVGAGNCFYIGGDVVFLGIKIDVTVAIALGAGSITREYWDGSAWTEFKCLSCDSGSPYNQYAQASYERVASEQMRFDEAIRTNWATKLLNGSTKYWVRFRVVTGITTAPTLEQVKLHTDRTEINADGMLEFFGAARPLRSIPFGPLHDAVGFASGNQNVLVGANTGIVAQNNKQVSTAKDGSVFAIRVPEGIDTSQQLHLEVRWAVNGTGTGDVEQSAAMAIFSEGDVLDGTISETIDTDIITIASAADGVVQLAHFHFNISDALPGDTIAVTIFRDATAGNLNDTLGNNTYLVAGDVTANFWR